MMKFRSPALAHQRESRHPVVEGDFVSTLAGLTASVGVLTRRVLERHGVVLRDAEDASLAMVAVLVAADVIVSWQFMAP